MRSSSSTMPAADGTPIHVYEWLPDGTTKAVVQVSHGMAEHAARYARVAQRLTDAGYAVYADDHRGHGQTAGSLEATGFLAERDGFETVVGDLLTLTHRIKAAHPGLPVFLFGHSWGSMLARGFAIEHGEEIAGLALSGTGGDPGMLGKVGSVVAAVEGRIRGRHARSKLLDSMSFGSFNKAFAPNRTGFDWLSRDDAEVDAYIADPYCGFVCTTGFFSDLLHGIRLINDPAQVARVRVDLPVLLFSGALDPVGGKGAGVHEVAEQFRTAGLRDVSVHLYPEARHEILNETNRDEVTDDLVAWLDEHVSPTAA
jgi:alpha-beta hydrolase superfamily lysophospholipase